LKSKIIFFTKNIKYFIIYKIFLYDNYCIYFVEKKVINRLKKKVIKFSNFSYFIKFYMKYKDKKFKNTLKKYFKFFYKFKIDFLVFFQKNNRNVKIYFLKTPSHKNFYDFFLNIRYFYILQKKI